MARSRRIPEGTNKGVKLPDSHWDWLEAEATFRSKEQNADITPSSIIKGLLDPLIQHNGHGLTVKRKIKRKAKVKTAATNS